MKDSMQFCEYNKCTSHIIKECIQLENIEKLIQ